MYIEFYSSPVNDCPINTIIETRWSVGRRSLSVIFVLCYYSSKVTMQVIFLRAHD